MSDKKDVEILAGHFPSNTRREKAAAQSEKKPADKKLEKVVKGKVKKQKRSLGKKMAETFLEDDTKSVGNYVFWDVMIPAAKSMICDMVGWGGMAEMILFGDKKGHRTRREGGRSHTSYGSYYGSSGRNRERDSHDKREISRTGRTKHDFDEIVLETRGEAEEVLSHLVDLTMDYGMASVADLYDLVGITSNFTDNNYGWTDLRNSSVNRVRDGYLLNLPRTQPLD